MDNIGVLILGENFKYVSMLLGFNDVEISIAFLISTYILMFNGFLCAFLY